MIENVGLEKIGEDKKRKEKAIEREKNEHRLGKGNEITHNY